MINSHRSALGFDGSKISAGCREIRQPPSKFRYRDNRDADPAAEVEQLTMISSSRKSTRRPTSRARRRTKAGAPYSSRRFLESHHPRAWKRSALSIYPCVLVELAADRMLYP
jgi:hypothetical protein